MAYCFNPVCSQPQNPTAAHFCQACGTALILENRYRLISLLGAGGFGRTFLATTVLATTTVGAVPASLDRPQQCVIKQITKSAVVNASSFQAEADRLSQLGEHPQIPRLFDAFENDLGQFLVQEFAPGKNLQQQVADQGPWHEKEVRSLLKSLVAVLQYVHGFQIIHRDIKPDNIVSKLGAPPMLVDFGSAKWVRKTPAKTVIGSAGYASPEQSMGQATFASDIYSLGLTCLHLLTGIHPFGLYSAAEDRWVWQDYLTSPIEPRLAQVLNQMVARSLQQRYESMDQVDLDLKFSQNLLLTVPQQLLAKAKESMPGLRSFLQVEGDSALAMLKSKAAAALLLPGHRPGLSGGTVAAQSWQRLHRLAPGIGVTQALAVSPDGRLMVSGGLDGSLHLWDMPAARLTHTFSRRRLMGTGHRGGITALAFHPDGRALYSASADGTVKEWDLAERQLLNTLPAPGWTPTDLLVTSDGTQLISANRDGKIVVWEIASLLPVTQLTQHQRCVNAIAFSQNSDRPGGLLASASDDGTVKLWKRMVQDDCQLVPRLAKSITLPQAEPARKGLAGRARAIALALRPLSQHAQQLIVATEHSVLLYHLNTYFEGSVPITLYRSEALITAIAVSQKTEQSVTQSVAQSVTQSEAYLAVGTEDRLLTLWQLKTGRQVATLAHDWGVGAIAFTPDSHQLITASADEVISIWQQDRQRDV